MSERRWRTDGATLSPAGYEWVGWKNDSRHRQPVEITFEFETVRNFSAVHIYTNNFFTKDMQVRPLLSTSSPAFYSYRYCLVTRYSLLYTLLLS